MPAERALLREGDGEWEFRPTQRPGPAVVLADGSGVLVADGPSLLRLARDGRVAETYEIPGDPSDIDRIAASDDGSVLVVHQAGGAIRGYEARLRQWNGPIPCGKLRDLRVSANGETVLLATADGVQVLRSTLATTLRNLIPEEPSAVAVSATGEEWLAALPDGGLVWFDRFGEPRHRANLPGKVECLAADVTLSRVFVGVAPRELRLVARGRIHDEFAHTVSAPPAAVDLARNGALGAAVLGDGSARAFAGTAPGPRLFLPSVDRLLPQVVVAADGSGFAAPARDGQLVVADPGGHRIGRWSVGPGVERLGAAGDLSFLVASRGPAGLRGIDRRPRREPGPPASPGGIHCDRCGASERVDSTFCSSCGERLPR